MAATTQDRQDRLDYHRGQPYAEFIDQQHLRLFAAAPARWRASAVRRRKVARRRSSRRGRSEGKYPSTPDGGLSGSAGGGGIPPAHGDRECEFCSVVSLRNSARSSATRTRPDRTAARALPDGSTAPATSTRPASCGSRPASVVSNVVLPRRSDRAAPQSHPRRSTDPGHAHRRRRRIACGQPAALQNAHGCTFLVSTVVAVVSPGAACAEAGVPR